MESYEDFLEKKPLKSKRLKIIDHLGTYYATFDGTNDWKIEKWLFNLIRHFDGTKTFGEIADYIARIADISVIDARENLKEILDELEREKFITYL